MKIRKWLSERGCAPIRLIIPCLGEEKLDRLPWLPAVEYA